MDITTLSDKDLALHTMTAHGMRVRVKDRLSTDEAELLMRRGLVELQEDADAFEPEDPQGCLKVTQYGFDLMLGRVSG